MQSSASLLVLVATLLTCVMCGVQDNKLLRKPVAPFTACIDDSDCIGNNYACFQYICYPWKDDTVLAAKDKKITCKSNEQCSDDLTCFRHHDRRTIHKGLCMEPTVDCSENGKSDCPNRQCCNGQFCCADEYYNQLKQLSCVNHMGCKDLGYGNFCCPNKSNSTLPSVCCNEDPNPPPPTTTPKHQVKSGSLTGGGSSTIAPFISSIISFAVVLALRQ